MNVATPRLQPDERALAERCAARDLQAIALVTKANNQRLFRAAWSILKDRTEAEDAVQSGYLKAFASIASFEGRSSLSTWLTRIVINEALARKKAMLRRHHWLASEGVTMMDDYRRSDAPDEALAVEQFRTLMERAIARLPDSFRTVFVLRDVEGMSVEETAETLDIPSATVKTRLFRARRRMRDILAPELGGAVAGTFPFAGADCDRMTHRVIEAMRG